MSTAAKLFGAPEEATADLRGTLDWLRAEGDLIETDREVDPDLQITGLRSGPFPSPSGIYRLYGQGL